MKRGEPAAAIEAYAAVAAQFSRGGFDAKAVAIFKQILKVDAQNLDAHVKLGEHFQRMGLASDAMRELNEAVRICQERGLKREAFDLLKRIAALDPANIPNRLRLADLLARENLLEEARGEYHSLLDQVQGSQEPAHVLRVAEQLMRVFPEDDRGVPAWVRSKLALGEGDAALRHLKKLLATSSDNIALREQLVEVYRARGDQGMVRSTYREIAELHKRRGDHEAARDILQRFVPVETFETTDPLTSPSLILEETASDRTRSAPGERGRASPLDESDEPDETPFSLESASFAQETGDLGTPSPWNGTPPPELRDEPPAPARPEPVSARRPAAPPTREPSRTPPPPVQKPPPPARAPAPAPTRMPAPPTRMPAAPTRMPAPPTRTPAPPTRMPAPPTRRPAPPPARTPPPPNLRPAAASRVPTTKKPEPVRPAKEAPRGESSREAPHRSPNTTPVGDSLREVLAEARVSLVFGDLQDARRRAEAALRLDARSAVAKDLLDKVAAAEKQAGSSAELSDPSLPDLEIVLEDDADQDDDFASVEPPAGLIAIANAETRRADVSPLADESFEVDIDVEIDADLEGGAEDDDEESREEPAAASGSGTTPPLRAQDEFEELDFDLEAAARRAGRRARAPDLDRPERASAKSVRREDPAAAAALDHEIRALEEAAASWSGAESGAAASRETLIDLHTPPKTGDSWFETSQSVSESMEEADFYLENDMIDEAERAYRQVLERVPQHPGAQARLGEIARKRGQPVDREAGLADSLPLRETVVPVSADQEPVVNPELTQPEFAFEEPLVRAELTQPAISMKMPEPPQELLMPEPFEPVLPPEPLTLDPLGEADETPTAATPEVSARPAPTRKRAEPAPAAHDEFRLELLLDEDDDEPPAPDSRAAKRPAPAAAARLDESPERLDAGELFRELPGGAEEAFARALDLPGRRREEDDEEEGDLDLAALLEADAGSSAGEPQTFDQVLEAFKRGIQQQFSADDAPAHYDLAIAYKEMGLVSEAVEQLGIVERAVGLGIEGLALLAACKLELDRPQEAAGHLSQALVMTDESDDAVVALRYDLGEALLRAGKRGEALDNFRKAAAIDAGYRDVKARIAELAAGT